MSDVGRDYQYRKARKQVLAGAQTCAICGGPLDFSAPPRSPRSASVDHILPVSRTRGLDPDLRAELAVDMNGLRAAHYGCNSRRGNKRHRPVHVSRSW